MVDLDKINIEDAVAWCWKYVGKLYPEIMENVVWSEMYVEMYWLCDNNPDKIWAAAWLFDILYGNAELI